MENDTLPRAKRRRLNQDLESEPDPILNPANPRQPSPEPVVLLNVVVEEPDEDFASPGVPAPDFASTTFVQESNFDVVARMLGPEIIHVPAASLRADSVGVHEGAALWEHLSSTPFGDNKVTLAEHLLQLYVTASASATTDSNLQGALDSFKAALNVPSGYPKSANAFWKVLSLLL